MARGKAVQNRVSFNGGLITERNPVNQEPNSLQSVKNFRLARNGDIYRRLGIGPEAGGAEIVTGETGASTPGTNPGDPPIILGTRSGVVFQEYYWDNPGNNPAKALSVVQIGSKLYFFDVSTDTPSANLANGGVSYDLSVELSGRGFSPGERLSFAQINGYLVITSKTAVDPHFLAYSPEDDVFTFGKIIVEVRDIWGVDDALGVTEKPADLTKRHLYNLLNQGWGETEITETRTIVEHPRATTTRKDILQEATTTSGTFDISEISQVFTDRSTYPSNAEIQSLYSNDPAERVRTNSSPAPKGRFIIDAFSRGTSRASVTDLSAGTGDNLKEDKEQSRIGLVHAAFDRMFYSGIGNDLLEGDINSPIYSNTVFFSKIIESERDFGKCYQEADPTSEDFSELVASDGGFITIAEANNVLALDSFGPYLLVFCDNGVWSISGIDNVFKATDYVVQKVTSVGISNRNTIVEAEGALIYWSTEGIYVLQQNPQGNGLVAQSLIQTTIQSFYNDIPAAGKLYAKGTYDEVEKRVRWLYNDLDSYDGFNNRYNYNKELIYDTILDAWYVYDFNGVQRIQGYVKVSPYNTSINQQAVVHSGDLVTYLGEEVVYTTSERTNSTSTTKYLGCTDELFNSSDLSVTLYELNNTSFIDWEGETEEADADASFITSWENGGDVIRRKDLGYLFLFLRRTETGLTTGGDPINPSSCLVRMRWEFADNAASGRWSRQREMYRYKRAFIDDGTGTLTYGQSVITTKNRVRGYGKVLAVEVSTSPANDLHLHGWSMTLLGNQSE